MGKSKTASADLYLVDLYKICVRVWPLFGLDRLVKLSHRKRAGILYCDNVMCMGEAITFSQKNTITSQYTIYHTSPGHGGVVGEPRLNAPNEASAADLERFHDDGNRAVFAFTPKKGKTFSIESDLYKPYDAGHRYVVSQLPDDARIARWELTLDISAYLQFGYSHPPIGAPPRCEFERGGAKPARGPLVRGPATALHATEKGAGLWQWHVDRVAGGIVRMAWELEPGSQSPAAKLASLKKKLATELSINTQLAKDLHNFVMICHYYVAGFRSLHKIGPEMMTDESVLRRSIESIEGTIETELIRRTKGKGLISVTPAGEAALDWWSQFYMRWTPIAPDRAGSS